MKRILLTRGALFLAIFGMLLLVNNQYHMQDEYRFAVSLDQGIRIFYAQHMFINFNGYVVWFFSTLLGIDIGAYRALQVTSSVFAAIGAVALIDLGIFWGLKLRSAIFFSLPIIFSNVFVRYGTSAYPDASAMGLGLVATNLLCRAVARQKDAEKNIGQVVEGIVTAKHVHTLATKLNVDMPITEQVYRLLQEQCSPQQAVFELLNRRLKSESGF